MIVSQCGRGDRLGGVSWTNAHVIRATLRICFCSEKLNLMPDTGGIFHGGENNLSKSDEGGGGMKIAW